MLRRYEYVERISNLNVLNLGNLGDHTIYKFQSYKKGT